jgi:hypothetical protein
MWPRVQSFRADPTHRTTCWSISEAFHLVSGLRLRFGSVSAGCAAETMIIEHVMPAEVRMKAGRG